MDCKGHTTTRRGQSTITANYNGLSAMEVHERACVQRNGKKETVPNYNGLSAMEVHERACVQLHGMKDRTELQRPFGNGGS
jgi:hypothetical protein